MKPRRPRNMARHITSQIAGAIETKARDEKRGVRTYSWSVKDKKAFAWTAGRCRICGECYEVLTNYHAERHGFKDKEEMIKAGAVEPIAINGMVCVEEER